MTKPLFSIVMPVLNAAPYLARSLCSVLEQAGDDTEVIVVDGGSTDGSVEVIEGLLRPPDGEANAAPSEVVAMTSVKARGREMGSSKVLKCGSSKMSAQETEEGMPSNFRTLELKNSSTRFLWCSEPDGGQSAALNKGFAQARGDFFFWVNGDDLLMPGTLDKARAFLREHPECEWLAGNLVYIDEQDRVLSYAFDGKWHDRLYRHAPVRVYGPTSIFRRDLFERVGGFDESLHYLMDTDLWLRFKSAGARFERLPHVCWAFRVHGGSKTAADLRGATDPLMMEERARVYAKNGLRVTRGGLWLQRGWRLANGCYARAWWESVRGRGAAVDDGIIATTGQGR